MQLGKVVKSNSHCDYIVQVDDSMTVALPPQPEDFGFGSFVNLVDADRHWAVGIVYNSQLMNPSFMGMGPRLTSEPDPLFTPDLVTETRTLLWVVLVGRLVTQDTLTYGIQGIPSMVVPVNTPVRCMTDQEIYRFHLNPAQQPQFCYYSHLLHCGGTFASQLTQQVLQQLIDTQLFTGADQRALHILCKELAWKNTVTAMR